MAKNIDVLMDFMETNYGYYNKNEDLLKLGICNKIPYAIVPDDIEEERLKYLYNEVLLKRWEFAPPKVVISIHGENKQLNSNKDHKRFKQMLIDILKLTTMWIITSGNKNGVHELVSEAVEENRQDNILDKTILLGIKRHVLEENCELNVNDIYNGYLLYQTETNSYYLENIQTKFESFLKKTENINTVHIIYDGDFDIFKPVFTTLHDKIPVVLIENSKIANSISKIIELSEYNDAVLNDILRTHSNSKELKTISNEIFEFKNSIILYDIKDEKINLNRKILEALISNTKNTQASDEGFCRRLGNSSKMQESIIYEWECFELSCIFDENSLNENSYLEKTITNDDKNKIEVMLFTVLKNNKAKALEWLMKIINTTDDYVDESFLTQLYHDSVTGNVSCVKELRKRYDNLSGLKSQTNSFCCKRKQQSAGIPENESFVGTSEANNKKYIYIEELFIWALLSGYTEVAFVLWKFCSDLIGTALKGAINLKKVENDYKNKNLNCSAEKIFKESKKYEMLAYKIIENAYDKSPIRAIELINRPLARWGNKSCLQISVNEDLKEFCSKSACEHYARLAWWDKELLNNRGKKKEKAIESSKEKFKRIFFSPTSKYWLYWISYFIFIVQFIYVNSVLLKPISLVKLKLEFGAEIFVFLYVFGLLVEEIKQIANKEGKTLYSRFQKHWRICWNIFDILIILLFFLSMICRFSIHEDYFVISRCLNAVTLSLFILRSLQFFEIFQKFGTKIIMIKKMLMELFIFLCLFFLFILAYGTLFQSIKNPNRKWDISLLVDIFLYPYFQMYGELEIDKFEIPLICSGIDCRVKYATIIIAFVIFLLLCHILLINLLIAIFGQKFSKVQDKDKIYFSFINIMSLKEFSEKSFLPPPLNIVYYLAIFIYGACHGKLENRTNNTRFIQNQVFSPREVMLSNYNEKVLREFEENILKSLNYDEN